MNVVLFGTSSFGLASFNAIAQDSSFTITGVVTQPARPVGRKQTLTLSPVAVWAGQRGLTVITPQTLKQVTLRQGLDDFPAELYVVASYGLILPPSVLALPTRGAVNIHASLLPKYRGASPISAAILNGDPATGITYMLMDPGCDTGPILQQVSLLIESQDTRESLESRLSQLAAQQITSVLVSYIHGEKQPVPQPTIGVSSAPRLSRADGHVQWHDAQSIERMVRAYTPWPGVWSSWKQRELRFLEVTVEEGQQVAVPGTVIPYQGGWAVQCVQGMIIPQRVQFASRSPQPAHTIPGSYPGFIGAVLN